MALKIIRAVELIAADATGTSDPYCIVKLNGKPVGKTPKVKKSLSPVFNCDFSLFVKDINNAILDIEIRDWNKIATSVFLGSTSLNLEDFDTNLTVHKEFESPLEGVERGRINYSLLFTPAEGDEGSMKSSTNAFIAANKAVISGAGQVAVAPIKGFSSLTKKGIGMVRSKKSLSTSGLLAKKIVIGAHRLSSSNESQLMKAPFFIEIKINVPKLSVLGISAKHKLHGKLN